MLEAIKTKAIDPKALAKAEGKNASKGAADLEGSLESLDFASELQASLVDGVKTEAASGLEANLATDIAVKPVEISAEQMLEMPSDLISPTALSNGGIETTTPKIFDPAMTKGVEKLISPETTQAAPLTDAQVIQLAQGEIATDGEVPQALLKTPQVLQANSGRAPGIDFAKSEIDPQLLNMEDFVAQKNLATKKAIPTQGYGMVKAPVQQKIALENGLKETQVVSGTNAGAEATGSSVNSQQFILGTMVEQKSSQVNDVQAAPKVFDMNQIKTSNPDQIVNQITDYIIQAKAAKEPTVNMRVNHDELGMIDITVSKAGMNHESIAINIGAHSVDGKNFFQQNSKDLFSHLTTAGLNVSDLKVETPTHTAKNDFDFGSQAGRQQQGSEKQFGSEQNQRRHDQERRQDLWKLLNKEAA